SRILTIGIEGIAQLWDTKTGRQISATLINKKDVVIATFSADSKKFATDGEDKTVSVFDAATAKRLATLNHPSATTSVTFSPDGKSLATSSKDETARVWDAETGKEIHTFPDGDETSMSVSFSPDGRFLLTAGGDEVAHLYSLSTGKRLATLYSFIDNNWAVATP